MVPLPDFDTATSGQLTVIDCAPELLLLELVSLSEVTLAVLEIPEAQLELLVVPVRVIVFVVPWFMLPKLQVTRVPPAMPEPVGEHEAPSVPPTVQVSPLGKVSVSTTLFEVPVPPAETTIV